MVAGRRRGARQREGHARDIDAGVGGERVAYFAGLRHGAFFSQKGFYVPEITMVQKNLYLSRVYRLGSYGIKMPVNFGKVEHYFNANYTNICANFIFHYFQLIEYFCIVKLSYHGLDRCGGVEVETI